MRLSPAGHHELIRGLIRVQIPAWAPKPLFQLILQNKARTSLFSNFMVGRLSQPNLVETNLGLDN
jgi:hypothetical protein